MMVTFVSQCEKKALNRTRRVLDAFANRIGDNTWQTAITQDGLDSVKKLLRMTATKNTAVACHWVRGKLRSELVWIVGNRGKFDSQGVVPVNSTKKSFLQNSWENDWHYLPLIKALVAIASLLHDWGKASILFQKKLKEGSKKGDPLRHEWVSCLLLNALVQFSGDTGKDDAWLSILIQNNWNEQSLKQIVLQSSEKTKALDQLPPIAQLIAWLIVSHHRLPDLQDESLLKSYKGIKRDSIQHLLKSISAVWGYQNKFDEEGGYAHRLKQCLEFEHGLLSQSSAWNKQIKKWALRLLQEQQLTLSCLDDGSWRVVLHHARLCLMLGDHYYSSCDKAKDWITPLKLIANTDKSGKAKQYLDEHLVYVSQHALQVAQSLSRLSEEMSLAYDVRNLKKKSPSGFEWQDYAVQIIRQFLQQQNTKEFGWFVVNMASTGKGKTIANAKIMQALSQDGKSLRYILALGLRTLTLQTGDSYRSDIGLGNDELAILIGSKAVQEFHQKRKNTLADQHLDFEGLGSESLEDLLDNELDYEAMPQADFMNALFAQNSAEKNKAFLYKPVLVCTIDHIMAATETRRGGRYILPCLRLLSSDLVIDEVDDFNGQDLVAITRLVHLAGMLGRRVMISSATIPPALAEGFFNAYYLGWKLYCNFKQLKNSDVVGAWIDEFETKINIIPTQQPDAIILNYKISHQKFVNFRVQQLLKQVVKHKAYIVKCEHLKFGKESQQQFDESTQKQYFELIKAHAQQLHLQHNTIDAKTGKKVSFGVVRVANTLPCVELTKYVLNADWATDMTPRVMAYHSRQVLLLRNEQEHHLDTVLKRKEKAGEQPVAFNNSVIREHLDSVDTENVVFILVATPVEEVGRDHDFDWAIIEPSSYRSIIQLSGRILRHRKLKQDISTPNIALMQYNLKGLEQAKVAFEKPGFEINNDHFRLETKDLEQLLDKDSFQDGINAIPRIYEPQYLQKTKRLADLEHAVMAYYLTEYKNGPENINGWLNETWFLTALPQRFNQFRQSSPSISLYATMQNRELLFCEKNDFGEYIPRSELYRIKYQKLTDLEQQRLWLDRNYYDILYRIALRSAEENEDIDKKVFSLSKRYGEIMLPEYDSEKSLMYSEQLGLVLSK